MSMSEKGSHFFDGRGVFYLTIPLMGDPVALDDGNTTLAVWWMQSGINGQIQPNDHI
jgi:hypothetical protein